LGTFSNGEWRRKSPLESKKGFFGKERFLFRRRFDKMEFFFESAVPFFSPCGKKVVQKKRREKSTFAGEPNNRSNTF
jgi:hypothetical protein